MAESDRSSRADKELHAIGTILRVLDGLDGESIQRVLDYVFSRLSLSSKRLSLGATLTVSPPEATVSTTSHGKRFVSIRDLKEEKQPDSANQMAAIVAFYYAELSPEEERKDSISTADLEKGFKQAGFKLPSSIRSALTNAAAAGYLDSIGNGQYKLNPVGYNLVAHALPRESGRTQSKRKPKKKSSRR